MWHKRVNSITVRDADGVVLKTWEEAEASLTRRYESVKDALNGVKQSRLPENVMRLTEEEIQAYLIEPEPASWKTKTA